MTFEPQAELLRAFELHRQGKLDQAEPIYRQILTVVPESTDAKQLLGSLMVQDGRPDQALPLLQSVLQLEPQNTTCLGNLGTAYSRLTNYPEAIACYRQTLVLEPNNPDVSRNLGSVLLKARNYAEAVPALRHALHLAPNTFSIQVNLAIALLKTDQDKESIAYFEQALEEQPNHRQALAGLGQLLLKAEVPIEKCADCWRRLADIEPKNPGILNNLATTYKGLKRFEEAETICRQTLEVHPNYFPALCNLGLVLASTGRFEEARAALRQALVVHEQKSHDAIDAPAPMTKADEVAIEESKWSEIACVAYCQLSATTNMLGDQVEAEWAVTKALEISPDNVESRMMRGFLNLQCGRYEQGWTDYEWRKRGKHAPRKIRGPEWEGQTQLEKTILLHAEQGLGDSIHFIRYARLVRERVGRVVFLSHKPLVKLMQCCPDLDEVIVDGEPLPAYDLQIPLLSLPAIFGSTMESLPREVPYLYAKPELVERWKTRLSGVQGFRIGIAWQGNREFANDEYRRVPLQQFGRLAEIPGVQLISLQKGDGLEQLEQIDFPLHSFPDMDTAEGAFMDSAAIMKNLDLVISPCTATPHLAGALGVPVWLAKSFAAEWRWLADDREANPWYPSMRMFRQPVLGEWQDVFSKMATEIQKLIRA